MPRTILLARPHAFIVSEMRPFLEQSGFAVSALNTISDLPKMVTGTCGAVISLALNSSIPESAETVFLELRRRSPRSPVLFASMLSMEQSRFNLEKIAKAAGITPALVGIDTAMAASAPLGQPNTFLYFSKEDLAQPQRKAIALKLIQRHFGQT